MIGVSGATGQLGTLIIENLIEQNIKASEIVAFVRDENKAKKLAQKGVKLRVINYDKPESLQHKFDDLDKLVLVSGSEVGKRISQHKNIIDEVSKTNLKNLIYTSLLKADHSPLALAPEHKETEKLIKESGLSYTILRNGWYTENYLSSLNQYIETNEIKGSAGDAKISAATRNDFSLAIVSVLTTNGHDNKTYELAGDEAFTLSELASAITEETGVKINYHDLTESDYTNYLVSLGVPQPFAEVLSSTETLAKSDWLFDDKHDLSKLIGRKTTSLKEAIRNNLK